MLKSIEVLLTSHECPSDPDILTPWEEAFEDTGGIEGCPVGSQANCVLALGNPCTSQTW